jgi:hypothetical protein
VGYRVLPDRAAVVFVARSNAGPITFEATGIEGPERMVVEGEQVLDMRHFHLTAPTVAMLRIYPDVRVQLHLEARIEN